MVKDFTPHHGTDLCSTCRHAFIREDVNGKRSVRCQAGYEDRGFMTAPTVMCNHYDDKTKASVKDMEKLAWIIVPSQARNGPMGFKPYKEMTNDERRKLDLEIDYTQPL